MHFFLFGVCSLLTGAFAFPTSPYVVHEHRSKPPPKWRRDIESINNEARLPIQIALTQRNLHKAEEFLMDVADPQSKNYGRHWTVDKIRDKFAPSEHAVQAVTTWLHEFGIDARRVKQSSGLNWIRANLTIAEAEALLQTKYYQYTHSSSGQTHVACEHYSIPQHIQQHIDFITPTLHFDVHVKKSPKRSVTSRNTAIKLGMPGGFTPKQGGFVPEGMVKDLSTCDVAITPDCLRALYAIPSNITSSSKSNDLDLFFRNFSPSLVGKRPIFDSIDGGVLQTNLSGPDFNGESNLDLEYAMALVAPQPVTLYQTGDPIEGASFNNFLDAIDGSYCTFEGGDDPTQDGVYPDTSDPTGFQGPENCGGFAATKTISTSYGYNEADLTPAYEQRQCQEYMKLGLQGITILYSSGDYGVAGNLGECIDPVTGAYNNGTSGMFNPSFPGTCPYVTSVGATQVRAGATVTQPEKAAESVIFSGGGFSNVFSMPSYQAAAVNSYFQNHSPPYGSDRFNNSQTVRGFPDVSANGVNYVVTVTGNFRLIYGTSASAPTFAAIMTLINGARLNAGKSSIGFINPTIYAHPEVFNDIVGGGNQGCGTAGFEAVEGWDPVTGLGTPNTAKMLKLFLSLP
ncbi:peptidase S8/S53 domain-containing protein [Xylogone sp. PMI_703]|nr:peptidase S8/S53 domain-containing protein [Xylogone sp. PMI_703]